MKIYDEGVESLLLQAITSGSREGVSLHSKPNHVGLMFWHLHLGLSCIGSCQPRTRIFLWSVPWPKHTSLQGLAWCSVVETAPCSPPSSGIHFWGFAAWREKWKCGFNAVVWMAVGWWGCNITTNWGQSLLEKVVFYHMSSSAETLVVFCWLPGRYPSKWVTVMWKNAVNMAKKLLGDAGERPISWKAQATSEQWFPTELPRAALREPVRKPEC